MAAVADLGGTPVKAYAAQNQYTHELAAAAKLQQHHCYDMTGYVVGPIEPQDFLDTFMKLKTDPGPAPALDIKPPSKNQTERQMYKSFHQAIIKSGVCTKTEFFIAGDRHSVGNTKIRPDGGLKESLPAPPTNGSTSRSGRPLRSTAIPPAQFDSPDAVPTEQYNFHNDGFMVEFKRQASDPFYLVSEMNKMDKPLLERNSGMARNTRGQLASYATETFAHQHRTHRFQLIVFGKYARFLYWDRSAAVVSGRFNYTSKFHPQFLAEFFWRYNHMTEAERGLDPTVTGTSDEEKKAFEVAVDKFLKELQKRCPNHEHMAGLMNTTKSTYPVRKIRVADASGEEPLDLIVQRPFHHPHAALGRATRAYLAYEPKKEDMYILKDTWRVVHKLLLAESEVYEKLRDAGAKNIPEIIRAGDVLSGTAVQTTKAQEWASKTEARAASGALRTHHHHRLVQSFAYTADTVENSKQWISIICDCLETMEIAEKCRVLHRDISLGNIMISPDGSGLLIDWDHSGLIIRPEGYEHQKFRTGTWQFMSCALLSNLGKLHGIQDDLESIFWVTLFKSLHDFDHEGTFDMAIFEYRHVGTSQDTGGDLKENAIGKICTRVTFKSEPLQKLIASLTLQLHSYYSMLPIRKLSLSLGMEVPPQLESLYEDLQAKLSSVAWWKKEFIAARDAEGWDLTDLVADKYPQTTKAARTIAINTVKASTLDRMSTCEIPQWIDPGSGLKQPKNQEPTAEEQEGHESLIADDNTSGKSDEVQEGTEDEDELEKGDPGGEDLPPSDLRQTSCSPKVKEAARSGNSKPLPPPQLLAMLPPALSKYTPPSSSNLFSASGSALSFPPSSAGTKRTLSDFSEGDDDVGASPRSKRARPVARANLQLAAGMSSRSPSRGNRASRSPSRDSDDSM